MNHDLAALLDEVAAGRLSAAEALQRLERARDLGFAVVDHERAARCGFPEVVLCQGKTPAQATAIAAEILQRAPRVLLTRADAAHVAAIRELRADAEHHELARCVTIDPQPLPGTGCIAIVAAGTADLPVAEEARVTAAMLGADVRTFYDIGVAGLHRLLERLPGIRAANAVVVVAGMDGALPSVLAGLVSRPVIAAPTSIGYGASFAGLAALLTMLNSCAAGVAVVNIDNGFGAGYLASQINRMITAPRQDPA
jgi:hypothetical protein